MKRKVIQIADSTQLISLPRKWVLENGVKKGDELDVSENGNRLMIITNAVPENTSVTVDISGLDRTSIIFLIRGLYIKGYDEMTLTFRNPTCPHFRTDQQINVLSVIHKEVNRLNGMEIFQQKESVCILKAVSTPSDRELSNMIRRIFLLLVDAAADLLEAVKKNNPSLLETQQERHDTITKFLSYCLRISNKMRRDDVNSYLLYHILANIDALTDVLLTCSRDLKGYNEKLHKETVAVLDIINDSFVTYQTLFHNFKIEHVRKMNENKEQVNKEILRILKKIPAQEVLLLCTFRQCLELFRDLTGSRMAMEF